MTQNYKNHIRFYTPHHFVFYPLLFILIGLSIRYAWLQPEERLIWIFISIGLIVSVCLSFMMRQHYALMNQNRIVKLEMRFRYYVLTGQRLELLEPKLSFGQIAALRFASDEELPALTARAIAEQLSPDQIKQAIVNWLPDEMRV